jgi:hypothetical protein
MSTECSVAALVSTCQPLCLVAMQGQDTQNNTRCSSPTIYLLALPPPRWPTPAGAAPRLVVPALARAQCRKATQSPGGIHR